ncbi:MAG: cyclic nucleotide-binding domain-containing protein [Deltaproteobacteria bacterium]|jgi:cAMP-dependent protein kinase regulator|nr:cyclic nucleotide-binding domain-containing protein [Deltaproteobacteria bacterium]
MDRQGLLESAEAAEAAGDGESALALYLQLEALEPNEPNWACRRAEIYRGRQDRPGRIAASLEAALRFQRAGVPMKAVAMARLALSLDRHNTETMRVLALLQGAPAPAAPPVVLTSTPPTGPSEGLLPLARAQAGAPEQAKVALTEARHDRSSVPATADLIPKIPLFSEISPEAFRAMLSDSKVTEFQRDEVIFRKGDPSTTLGVVVEGTVAITLDDGRHAGPTMGAGEFFGELGVFTGKPRGATVRALAKSEILELELSAIATIVRSDPATLKVLLRFFGERLMANVLARAPLFSQLPVDEREHLRSRFSVIDVKRGTHVIHQGSRSEALFVLIDGTVRVERGSGPTPELVAHLGPGDMFGEISVLTQLPAVAHVVADTRCLLLALPADRLAEVAGQHPALLAHATRLAEERMNALAPKPQLELVEVLGA